MVAPWRTQRQMISSCLYSASALSSMDICGDGRRLQYASPYANHNESIFSTLRGDSGSEYSMIKQQTDPAPGYIQTSLMLGNVVLAEEL